MQERKDKWSVGQWMTQNPYTVTPDTSVRVAFFRMRFEELRHLMIVEEGSKKLLGIVSDRDLRRPDLTDEPDGWDEYYNLNSDYEVRDIMTSSVKTVKPGDSLEKAMRLMLEYRFSAVPVLDKRDELIGILSSHDIMKAFSSVLTDFGDVLRK